MPTFLVMLTGWLMPTLGGAMLGYWAAGGPRWQLLAGLALIWIATVVILYWRTW